MRARPARGRPRRGPHRSAGAVCGSRKATQGTSFSKEASGGQRVDSETAGGSKKRCD